MNNDIARFNMIEQQIRPWEVLDGQVLSLLSVVKRENFVPLAHKALAFADMEIPLQSSGAKGQCMLAPKVEETLRAAIRQTSAGSYLALDPAIGKKLVETIKKTVGKISPNGQRPVMLASMDIRRYLRKMIEQDLYDLQVVSYQELVPDVNVQPLGRIDL